jgi:hypothetical protein
MQLQIPFLLFFTNLFRGKSLMSKPAKHRPATYQAHDMSRTCRNVSMDEFLRNLCDGEQTMDAENWTVLLAEYYELKEELPDQTILLARDITRLHSHLNLLDKTITALRTRISTDLLAALKGLGYQFRALPTEGYHDRLDAIVNKSKTKYMQLQQYIVQLDVAIKRLPKDQVRPKREYFEGLLIAIEEMQKVAYSMDTIMILKFTQLEKKYWRYVDAHRRINK